MAHPSNQKHTQTYNQDFNTSSTRQSKNSFAIPNSLKKNEIITGKAGHVL